MMTEMTGFAGCAGAALLAAGAVITDVKQGRISRLWLVLGLLLAATAAALSGRVGSGLLGAIPGLVLLLTAVIFRNALEKEDAALACAGGIFLGPGGSLEVLFYGFLLCSAAGVVICLAKGRKRGRRILFSPFYAAGLALFIGGTYVW